MPRGVHSQAPQEGALRRTGAVPLGGVRKLALQKESRIEQGHLMLDHVSDPNSRFERPHL
jgi:hypothetical protein